MPGWYYDCQEDFRLPLPVEYELAYIDKTGRRVIEAPLRTGSSFAHGRAVVSIYSQRIHRDRWYCEITPHAQAPYRILNESGGYANEINYDYMAPFYDQMTIARSQNQSFLLDSDGNVMQTFAHANMLSVSEGLIRAKNSQYQDRDFYDLEGKLLFSADCDEACDFREGLARIKSYTSGVIGYINKSGVRAITCDYDSARDFHHGHAAAKSGGAWGLIDSSGAIVIPFKYDYVGDYDSETKLLPVRKGEYYGFVDLKNKLLIEHEYAGAKGFNEGLAAATLDGLKWGYINPSGKFVIKPTFQHAMPFAGDRALVYCDVEQLGHIAETSAAYPVIVLKEARRLREEGQYEAARKVAEEVIALSPDSEAAKRAEAFIRTELPLHPVPDEVVAWYLQAIEEANSQNLKVAETLYQKCIMTCPTFELPYGALAYVYFRNQNLDGIEQICRKVLEFNPNYLRAHERLILVYKVKGLSQKVEEATKRLDEINPYRE